MSRRTMLNIKYRRGFACKTRRRTSAKRLQLFFSILIIIVGLSIAAFNLMRAGKIKAAWFNDRWYYRKSVQISNSSGSALTDFQVSISVGTSANIAAGKMKSDCSDIRITDTNGKLLPHWLEEGSAGCNAVTDTNVWVKVPSIPSSGGAVYLYYGNPSARNIASGNKVFEFFDDFSTDLRKWTSTTGFSVSNGQLHGTNTQYRILSNTAYSGNYIYETRTYTTTQPANGYSTGGFWASTSDSWGPMAHATNLIYVRNDAGWLSAQAFTLSQWVRYKVTGAGASSAVAVTGETSGSISFSASNTISNEYVALGSRQDYPACCGAQVYSADWDWVFVRKAASTNPTSSLSSTEEQAKSPVAYWAFDEGQGTTAHDSSTQANNGSLGTGASAPAWQTEDMCISGKCLYFDGTGDYVNVPTSTSLNIAGAITIEAWIKTNSITQNNQTIVAKNTSSNTGYWLFYNFSTPNNQKFDFFGVNNASAYSSASPTANQWTHVVVIREGTNVSYYINGRFDVMTNVGGTVNAVSDNPLRIGTRSETTGYPFNGFLDEVKIYPYARSAAVIKADYNSMKNATSKGSSVKISNKSVEISNGLVGYWKMDEASWSGAAGEVIDSSGNANHGVGVGSTIPTTGSGKFGNGGVLNGANTISIAHSTSLKPSSYISISAWVNPSNITTNTYYEIYRKEDGSDRHLLSFQNNGTILSFGLGTATQGYQELDVSITASDYTNAWHLITAVYDGQKKYLYKDGVQIGSQVATGAIGTPGTANSYIGSNAGTTEFFAGSLDEVRIYNRALSPAEVRNLYNWAPGPVAYYNFNEGVGSSAYDTSGYGNNGVWSGTGTHYGTGKYGKAGKFNGSDDYINAGSGASLNIPSSYTLSLWLRRADLVNYKALISKYSNTDNQPYYALYTNGSQLRWQASDVGDATRTLDWYTNYSMSANTWYHVALIYDGSYFKLYVNGVFREQQAWAYGFGNNTSNLYIGHFWGGKFNGSIDEVKIYNYARTQKQIVEDMGNAPAGASLRSTLAKYSFDEGYGTTVRNDGFGGSSLNGTLGAGSSAPTWSNDGKFGKALSFDGSNDYVQMNTTAFQFTTGDFSATIWANPTVLDNSYDGLITTDNAGDTAWKIFRDANNQYFRARYASTLANYPLVTTGVWHQYGYVKSGSNLILYLDGKLTSTTTISGSITGSATSLVLGSYRVNDALNSAHMFNGLIDEVKIYNYALTEDEVKLDYNRGSAIQMGSLSSGTGNTAPATAASQEYCIPGDSTACLPPVARWDFNEGTGTSAFDTSGNSNNGALGSGSSAPTWANGKVGKALQFSSSNSSYVISSSDPGTMSNGTYSLWVKPSTDANMGWIDSNFDIFQWAGNLLYFRAGNQSSVSISSWSPNTWHHLALMWNGSNYYGYIDGVQVTSGVQIGSRTGQINIGRVDGGYYFTGSLDQVRIYNYARTPAQIAWDFNKGKPTAWWDFDECQGTTAHDRGGLGTVGGVGANSGSINIGALGSQTTPGTCTLGVGQSAAWANGATGKYNASLNFDGTDDFISIGSTATYIKTLSFWAKPSSTTQKIIQLSSSDSVEISSGTVTVSGFGTETIYVDGKQNASFPDTNWHQVTVISSSDITANQIYLGRISTNYYSGQIDDVSVFNYALTAQQVKTLYNQGSSVRFGPATGSP